MASTGRLIFGFARQPKAQVTRRKHHRRAHPIREAPVYLLKPELQDGVGADAAVVTQLGQLRQKRCFSRPALIRVIPPSPKAQAPDTPTPTRRTPMDKLQTQGRPRLEHVFR